MMMIILNTILKVYRWGGTVNQYLTGCINFMVLDRSSNVKYVEVQATGEEKLLKNISKSGAMHTA